MNKNDIYSHLMNGGDPQVLLDAFLKDMNEAQAKVDAERAAAEKRKKEEEAKKAAKKEVKAKKEEARKAAIAAAMAYYALVYPEFSAENLENLEEFAKTAVDSVAQSIEFMKKLESGKHFNFDWLL